MTVLVYLIPIALLLGLAALFAFLWALKSGQYEDLEGEASRILFEEDEPPAASPPEQSPPRETTAEDGDRTAR